jgi:hypothetical protein
MGELGTASATIAFQAKPCMLIRRAILWESNTLYLGHLFAELDVLRFIERAFLSQHTIGTYNHYGSESIAVLSFCLR